MTMRVQDLMTRSVVTCRTTDTLNQVAKLMWECDFGCVPVVDGDRPIGMITDRDICMAGYTQGKLLSEIPVITAMSKGVITCMSEDPVANAEATMRLRQLRRLPVIDRRGNLVGIL